MGDQVDNKMKVITEDNQVAAKLYVPTRSDGATISQSGWEIGGDTISRTTSKGKVEEDEYEDIVSKFHICEDHILMGVMLESSNRTWVQVKRGNSDGPNRHIRIPYSDITDVRRDKVGGVKTGNEKIMQHDGFTFETSGDVYKFVLFTKKNNVGFFSSLLKSSMKPVDGATLDEIVERIESKAENAERSVNSAEVQDDSIADELERIQELRDNGDLSEEEYEKAKKRILE